MSERHLTYEDLVQIVELVKSTSQFSEFRLKIGDIEVSLKRPNGEARPLPAPVQRSTEEKAVSREKVSVSENLHAVKAPMVGTFYRSPAPGEPPFVEVGQEVEPDTIVCIIEVMKLMNSIEAGVRGVVREIAVPNATAVEYGELLMGIEPRP
ncbi:MAG TPA: acetyl-CoA carboxylase biotin carboxyl carrier protein [Burkholderiales bacterium]|nr:acetyl-CoA carboxylase biotin carboxyl carrier protein [Burkholderiales bacterium]